MEILGTMDLSVRISNLRTTHRIYVSSSRDRELKIGGERLKKYNTVIYFNPPTLRVGKKEILLGKRKKWRSCLRKI